MSRRNITILCADVSINCLSRALTLAEVMSIEHDVRITGFARHNRTVWQPAGNSSIAINALPWGGVRNWQHARAAIRKAAGESTLVICKPRLMSMGLAMWAGINPDRAILDINDWELGLALESSRTDGGFSARELLYNPASPNSPLLALYLEKKIKNFPFRIVNNRWLQSRFGGELLYDVRNTELLDPEKFDYRKQRETLRLDNERPWVIFAGTPRPHKGLPVLLDALAAMDGAKAPGLMCCGGGSDQQRQEGFIEEAGQRLGAARVFHATQYQREEVARFLAAADIACIPALPTSSTVGQVPTKLFEAMAMGLPVVASDICDMAELTNGIGHAVPAGDYRQLAGAIQSLAVNRLLREKFAHAARRRAVEQFSYHAAGGQLRQILENVPEITGTAS